MHPPSLCLLFHQPYRTDPFCKWFLCKICLTNYRLYTHLSVPTAGSREQGLFFCALSFKTQPLSTTPQWHGSNTLLQLGGKPASRGWGLNSSWQRKQHRDNWLSPCLQSPKGCLGAPGERGLSGMDGSVWQTTSDKEKCSCLLEIVLRAKQSARPQFGGRFFLQRWHFLYLFSWKCS